MGSLSRELRRLLENTVKAARRTAEAGTHKAIEQLGVNHHEPWPNMTPAQRELRNRLRAHGRQLGDRRDERRGVQAIDHLTTECAYEHWHRMLFARFLAETELLIEPKSGVAISLQECEELALSVGRDWLDLAADFAQRMLPQIFRTGDPVLEVALPPETRSALEDLLRALPGEVFLAEDSLGWVYQYWQADRKEAINDSEKKIGAEELPAVTQLFTEDYMVFFLLHNTLGAWWAGKVLAANPGLAASAGSEDELRTSCALGGVEWTYLRFVRERDQPWRPAAGAFEGWPKSAKDITLIDPCMGSGHFLVFALPMLAALRAREEGITPETATLAVLRDNIFGLEIDPRCTQIAAFNLALAAWRRLGYRALPALHLACSGLSLGVNKAEWLKLAERAAAELPVPPKTDLLGSEDNLFSDAMKRGFERLYDLFARAPWLGSLIDPRAAGGDLVEYGFADLEPILAKVMAKAQSAEVSEMAVAAQGIAKAAAILSGNFTLVATNVPYLGRGKQDEVLKLYCEERHPEAKADLATCFIERSMDFCADGGSCGVVAPQNWLFLPAYSRIRKQLLANRQFDAVARLGANAFQNMNFWAATTALSVTTKCAPNPEHMFLGVDASEHKDQEKKARILRGEMGRTQAIVLQAGQLKNPDGRITLEPPSHFALLHELASAPQGLKTGDDFRLRRCIWELPAITPRWKYLCGAPDRTQFVDGASYLIDWGDGDNEFARLQGQSAWGRKGFVLKLMGGVTAARYFGELFDSNVTALIPNDESDIPAIWEFVRSDAFLRDLRAIEQSVKVNNATVGKVPCDIAHWRGIASQSYPVGLPLPESRDPTQWLFGGHPKGSDVPLQVAVARLVGYRWPRQTGSNFPDCPGLAVDGIETHADRDGIVPLSPVKGEQSAVARLTALLSDALGAGWSASKLNSLLTQVGYAGKTLDDWLRDAFFEQHCALFHQRPFVWHVWDGRGDGFHALVNYHRLAAPNGEGRRTLEKLLYSYLGDWIDRQRADQKAGVEGADARVAAAEQLRVELMNILAGEPPYDLFVRWKSLVDQPIGWTPDINDGVRMNIRPFLAAKPLGARGKGACILRATPKTKWEKDRGKEPQRPREDFPWFWGWDERAENFEGVKTFDGNRWNDLHYSRSFKEAARARSKK
jgi:N-6 DNA Methylase